MKPVSVIDKLIKGIVLFVYDFVIMTSYGLAIPFVRNRYRFWRALISEEQYLSPLTYLVFWVLLTVAMTLRSGTDLVSNAAGFEAKRSSPDVIKTIALALTISVLADVFSRIGLRLRRSGRRLQFYDGLMRIAVANLFVGACAIMVLFYYVRPLQGRAAALGPIYYLGVFCLIPSNLSFYIGLLNYIPNPLLILFSASLGIIFVKAMVIRERKTKWIIGSLFAIAVPILLFNLAAPAFRWVYLFVDTVSESSRTRLYSTFTECTLQGDQIHVTGYLRVEGAKTVIVRPRDFAIYDSTEGPGANKPNLIAKILSGTENHIIVSESRYTPLDLTAAYGPENANIGQGKFDCYLFLLEGSVGGELPILPSPD
jgi:hypothetical protein